MNAWLVIAAVGAGTYALRVSMFFVVGRRSLPAWTERPASFVGPAAIAALVASMLFTQRGSIEFSPFAEVIAVLAGFLTVRRTGNVIHACLVGMPLFWMLSTTV